VIVNVKIHWQPIALAGILLVAAFFRFYGLAWDGGYLLHPDERKIVLVASGLAWPSSLLQFFSSESPLNPKFFAYGSFPIYLLRALSILAPHTAYNVPWREDYFVALGMLGRVLSGLFDLGTMAVIFFLGRRLYNATVGLIASACVAVTVLHIQLSHFYAVDTLLTLLVVATVFFAARYAEMGKRRDFLLMSGGLGLALATKITAAPLIVPVVLAVVRANETIFRRPGGQASAVFPVLGARRWLKWLPPSWKAKVDGWIAEVLRARPALVRVVGIAFVVFIVTQPYMLLDPIRYFGQVGTEALVARGWLDYPYTRQYAGSTPFIYQIVQSTVWGMGLPLGMFAWGGTALFVVQWWRKKGNEWWRDGFVLSWALVYFLTIGAQYAKYLRYLLPLSPFLFLMAAAGFGSLIAGRSPRLARALRVSFSAGTLVVVGSAFLYSLAYISIYTREHPWLQLSDWIYQNVPSHSTIITEQWDDTLPLPMQVNGQTRLPTEYQIDQLPMYDSDTPAKMQSLADELAKSDYVLLASQRLYATISRLPARYPETSRYYELLFTGQLGFELVTSADNNPSLGSITITEDNFKDSHLPVPSVLAVDPPGDALWNWGRADESFTVYDHPMPLLFKKTRSLSAADLLALLDSQ
jgi:hypothetical protein